MSLLWGWLGPDGARVADAMGRALRTHPGQVLLREDLPGFSLGILEPPGAQPLTATLGPNRLWVAGELLGDGLTLLGQLAERGPEVLRKVEGEFQLLWWNGSELVFATDRFGSLPLYWAESASGFAFAGGVRGVLMAPGVSADPDLEALREAVSFGGFRLGDRTNLRAVKKLAPATAVTLRPTPVFHRYFHWCDILTQPVRPLPSLIEELHDLWRQAISRRIGGGRPGQTLSGGLDSRAILAEASRRCDGFTAITYGLPGCDDAHYAERAARNAGARWIFEPLYQGDWLEARAAHIQHTDGLIDLFDLCHLELLPLQARHLDVHLSGYIGDVVSGPTLAWVKAPRDVLGALPYYQTALGLTPAEAEARATDLVAALRGAPARFALHEHKYLQSTNGWTLAYRPWFRVRRPFIDHAFFDFCQGLPDEIRLRENLHERWLLARYPLLFEDIPNQKTGLPVLAPYWRWRLEQARRLTVRKLRLGPPRLRNYRDDDGQARRIRPRIEEEILRPGSLSCDLFGKERVRQTVASWFDTGAGAAQVVGALYVFERYHRELPARLREAR